VARRAHNWRCVQHSDGFSAGSGRRKTVLTMMKILALALIPNTGDKKAASTRKPGLLIKTPCRSGGLEGLSCQGSTTLFREIFACRCPDFTSSLIGANDRTDRRQETEVRKCFRAFAGWVDTKPNETFLPSACHYHNILLTLEARKKRCVMRRTPLGIYRLN
jgi:hypothetical protein